MIVCSLNSYAPFDIGFWHASSSCNHAPTVTKVFLTVDVCGVVAGCIGAYEKALEVLERTPNSYMLNQFGKRTI